MTVIYLIRHAEAEGNLYRIAQGQYDSLLTVRGWRQVRALEERFRDIPIDAVYSSDLYRACATASAIFRPKGLPLHRRADLREICVGCWEQRSWGQIARTHPGEMEDFRLHPDRWQVEGSETPRQVLERALASIRQIAAENAGRTVAVFSHGYTIRLVLASLQGYSVAQLAQTPVGDNTAVSMLQAEGEDLRVVYRDDSSHLKTLEPHPRRSATLEPGLWFRPPAGEEDLLARSGGPLPQDTAAVVGCLDGEAVGLIAFGPPEGAAGLIRRLFVREEFRRRGYGCQLIGQAVQHFRHLGCTRLRLELPPEGGDTAFLADHGFVPADPSPEGWKRLEKDIGFDWSFLGRAVP